ncbi:acyltransferase [Rhizobium sp. BK376]|uniref:acyltransferase family protein n=1 Tax=Rhizobium sp. BK376 TaxID=2512149 RepID=UPI0024785A8C|nr:acyltransferase [Rhizobium sp. BK376]
MNIEYRRRSISDASRPDMPYRADIDGLRAIAILPVVFYHAGVSGFGGGFVGVDVFFVISGFLMAGLVGGELERNEFSLIRFYERRIRRIFPALFAVMIACAVAAWLLLMPVEMEYFARSLKAAAMFGSNFQFKRKPDISTSRRRRSLCCIPGHSPSKSSSISSSRCFLSQSIGSRPGG